MKLSRKIIPSAIAASLLLSFSACGGGGDSTTPTATPLSTVTANGTAVDGYISGGTACLDLSLDGICQSATEPTTTTNASGTFSLNVTAAHQTHGNYATAPVIVYGGKDIDTNQDFKGLMKAPFNNANNIVVSPLSTMVQAVVESGKTEAEAKIAVAGALGLNAEDILKDPVALYTTKPKLAKAAITIQKVVEILAQANVTKSTTNTTNEKEFQKIYAQLADSTIAVSQDSAATKSFTSVVTKAKNDAKLTDGAADASEVVSVIETAINDANAPTVLADLALVIDLKTNKIKTVVAANNGTVSKADAQTAADSAQDNVRVIKVEQYLKDVSATDAQITTVLALTEIQTLVDTANTTVITKSLLATAIANSFDATIANLATTLGAIVKVDLSGTISSDKTLTADKVWRINGLVTVNNGATLTIEPGTTIIGKAGTGANSSYMVIDKGAKIMAAGTADKHIVFTSETAYDGAAEAAGQWGSLVIIGNAAMDTQVEPYEVNPNFVAGTNVADDNSGALTYVDVLNSGITIEENKELNGLSMVGVGSGTTVDHIRVNKSDDDCIEIWGGTVNLSNIDLSECTDDHFDIDDGYNGTVSNLTIVGTIGNAGIEMSGNTAATFEDFNVTMNNSAKEGAIYFKKDGIGGYFNRGTVTYNVSNIDGAIHSQGEFDSSSTSFDNVSIDGNSTIANFTGDSATGIEAAFTNGTNNIQ